MEQTIQIHLFYPLLFFTLVFLGTLITIAIVKYKDSNLFQNIFAKSSDNAKEVTIDTTSKMKDMHDNVIQVPYTDKQEKELHNIETRLAKIEEDFQILSDKLDEFIAKVIELESK